MAKSDAAKKAATKKTEATTTTISVHPMLAKAILSLKKFGPEELAEIKKTSAQATAAGAASTACFISDSSGQQHCINLPPDVCSRQGGISLPTKCPNN